MELLLTSVASRTALGLVLTIFADQPSNIGYPCWQIIWSLLAMLRDCTLLPGQMIVDDCEGTGDSDLLPPVCRAEFEMRLKATELKTVQNLQAHSHSVSSKVKKSSSLLSFQGFGEAIFGSSQSDAAHDPSTPTDLSMVPLTRWDCGYETFVEQKSKRHGEKERMKNSGAGGSLDVSVESVAAVVSVSDVILQGENDTSMLTSAPVFEDKESILAAFTRLKRMIEACGIAQLVPDTRLLGDESLLLFTGTLIATAETSDGFSPDAEPTTHAVSYGDYANGHQHVSVVAPYVKALQAVGGHAFATLATKCVSASSVCWLEMILASVCARNRDRFSILWPLMSTHYRNTLLNAKKLTYSFERRVTGLLKITARAMVREAHTAQILEVFKLFVAPCKVNSEGDDGAVDVSPPSSSSRNSQLSTLRASLLADVACQISSGMWRLLTRNVQSLTSLALEQWQTIFDVISVGASAGGYASIKAFETVAWLLHEPRLLANVPVFIVICIRPLLGNPRVPVSVAVGAVTLLCHLHSRLEVLISNDDEDYVDIAEGSLSMLGGSSLALDRDQDSDTPVLWESCWTPILRLLADATGDGRVAVRNAASHALSRCILDRHIRAVPPGVLVNVLGDIVVPVILHLGENMIREGSSAPGSAFINESTTDVAFLGEVASYGREVLLRSTEQDGVGRIPIIECIGSLCFVFEEQIRRLSAFPTFDKLVLRMLHVFGYFLGAGSNSFDLDGNADQQIALVVAAALGHLTAVLTLLKTLGIFEQRPGLWSVTKETLLTFRNYSELDGMVS